jgi:hypothetical protein
LAIRGDGSGMDFGLDHDNRPESSTSGLAITGIEFGDGGEEADVEDGRDGSVETAGNGEAESSHGGGDEREREESLKDGPEGGKAEVPVEAEAEERERKELLSLVGDIGIIT